MDPDGSIRTWPIRPKSAAGAGPSIYIPDSNCAPLPMNPLAGRSSGQEACCSVRRRTAAKGTHDNPQAAVRRSLSRLAPTAGATRGFDASISPVVGMRALPPACRGGDPMVRLDPGRRWGNRCQYVVNGTHSAGSQVPESSVVSCELRSRGRLERRNARVLDKASFVTRIDPARRGNGGGRGRNAVCRFY
jgi:hypothetical protein